MLQLYKRESAGGQFLRVPKILSASLERRLMSNFRLIAELDSADDLELGDLVKLDYADKTYTFRIRRIQGTRIEADHISMDLANVVCLDRYLNNPPTMTDNLSFAAVSLDSILQFLDLQAHDHGFHIVNESSSTELLDIEFASASLLGALQQVAETWGVEFEVTDDTIYVKDKIEQPSDVVIVMGVNVDNINKVVDFSDLVTRIYPVGASDNLPANYFYERLRPTHFDLATGVHSGSYYLEDSEAIAQWGLIEKVVEFPDVKVLSHRGTIDSTGVDSYGDYNNVPYIQDDEMIGLDAEKAKQCTLFISQGLKAAALAVIGLDSDTGRLYYSPKLEDGTTLSWTPLAGDQYILVGYIGQAELDDAAARLRAAAQIYLNQHKQPKIKYTLANLVIDKEINLGDVLTFKDGVQERVTAFQYDLIRKVYTSVELANLAEKITSRLIREQIETRNALKKLTREEEIVKRFPLPPEKPEPEPTPADVIPPSNLRLSWGEDQIGTYVIAEWDPSPDAVSYRVRYSEDNGLTFTYITEISTTSVQFYVMPQTTVIVEVCAVNADDQSSLYIRGSIQVGGSYEPPAPHIKSVTAIFTTVQVELDFPTKLLDRVNCFHMQVSRSSDFASPRDFYLQGTVLSGDVPEFLTADSVTVYVRVRTISYTDTPSAWSNVVSTQIFKVKGQYIAEATIDSAHIKNAAIKSAHIDTAAITDAHIANLDASKITSGYINAARIQAGTITTDKLAATLVLQGQQIIAGNPALKHWRIKNSGIRRVIPGSVTWDREVATLLDIIEIRTPPTGIEYVTLPSPLTSNDVDVAIVPKSYPMQRSGLDETKNYSFKADWQFVDSTTLQISTYVVLDAEPVLIVNEYLIPTGNWSPEFPTGPSGTYTESVKVRIHEIYWFRIYHIYDYFTHIYKVPGVYNLRFKWGGLADCRVYIDYGDGRVHAYNRGSISTNGIYASVWATRYSSNPIRYYIAANVQILLFDKRSST